MSSFYNVANRRFSKYPPDLIKFAGDGYLAIWQTGVEDRKIAIDVCVEGTSALNSNWQILRQSPHFTHGAPEEIGTSISFGLASKYREKALWCLSRGGGYILINLSLV